MEKEERQGFRGKVRRELNCEGCLGVYQEDKEGKFHFKKNKEHVQRLKNINGHGLHRQDYLIYYTGALISF